MQPGLTKKNDSDPYSTLWISVSSKSSTRQYGESPCFFGSKNGGCTFGRFVKLFGKVAEDTEAIAEAFKIANGFLPVNEVYPLFFALY